MLLSASTLYPQPQTPQPIRSPLLLITYPYLAHCVCWSLLTPNHARQDTGRRSCSQPRPYTPNPKPQLNPPKTKQARHGAKILLSASKLVMLSESFPSFGMGYPTPHTLRHTPDALHPTTYTLRPTPYILHPTPYTLHPTLYTLHPTTYTPTPYTVHPTPYTFDAAVSLEARNALGTLPFPRHGVSPYKVTSLIRKRSLPYEPPMALGTGLLQGPRRRRFLLSEVPP